MTTNTTCKEDDIVARIAKMRDEGEQWFEVKIIAPYDDDQKENVEALQTNMEKMLLSGLELMSADAMQDLPDTDKPAIILPN